VNWNNENSFNKLSLNATYPHINWLEYIWYFLVSRVEMVDAYRFPYYSTFVWPLLCTVISEDVSHSVIWEFTHARWQRQDDGYQYNVTHRRISSPRAKLLAARWECLHLIKINGLALWLDWKCSCITRSALRGASCEDWKSALIL
jgi:hypothetical protein